MKTKILIATAAMALGAASRVDAAPAIFRGEFWNDGGFYGDGRTASEECRKTPDKAPHGHILVYRIDIPKSGWYAPFFKGGSIEQSYFVDGELVAFWAGLAAADGEGFAQGPSLWLEKGARELRMERPGRRGFPQRKFYFFELRPLVDGPECVRAEVSGHDVVRLGEAIEVKFSGGCAGAELEVGVEYAPLAKADAKNALWTQAATVSFPRTEKPAVRSAKVLLPEEGMFALRLVSDGKELCAGIFGKRQVVCVDMRTEPSASPREERELVCEIDCAATEPDRTANGETRVVTRNGLSYRESGDNADASRISHLSAFSYRVSVPEAQVPYLLEVEFPDDARRSAAVRHDWFDEKTDAYLPENAGYQAKSYETGGFFPLSGKPQKQSMIFWPYSKSGRVTAINTAAKGERAALAKIRIYKVPDSAFAGEGKPESALPRRLFAYWAEEGVSYRGYAGGRDLDDLAATDRFFRWARFHGCNAISGFGLSYNMAYWRSRALNAQGVPPFSRLRMFALLAEKHGMAFIPDIFHIGWFETDTYWPMLAGGDDAGRLLSMGGVYAMSNPLCPAVQDAFVGAMSEIFDEIGDSPAFRGANVRADPWQFRSHFFFKSLAWGYNESIVRAFAGETKTAIPAEAMTTAKSRHAFLTAPDMKGKWIRWRCDKIEAYHRRLLDALRGGGKRPDVFFGMAGQFDQENKFAKPETLPERALESGVDVERCKVSDGFSVIPVSRYGSRVPTVASRRIYDEFFRTDSTEGGMGSPRAFAAYMTYHELSHAWPWKELGFDASRCKKKSAGYHCSGMNAAGRLGLERFAVVLAEQDTAYFRDGGNADCFVSAELLRPWLAEYGRLPAVPFDRAPGPNDPVAVWHRDVGGAYWWYAVNKERFPCEATVRFTDGAEERVALEPFALKVFREDGARSIASAGCEYPEAERAKVEALIERARHVARQPGTDAAFLDGLAKAEAAAAEGKWWRCRVELCMAPMFAGFRKAGSVPREVLNVPFPDRLDLEAVPERWKYVAPGVRALDLAFDKEKTLVRDSASVNPEWRGDLVLWGSDGEQGFSMDVPADGLYDIEIGVVVEEPGEVAMDIGGRVSSRATAANGGISPVSIADRHVPATAVFRGVALAKGKTCFAIRSANGKGIGVYGARLAPVLRGIGAADWEIAGPFRAIGALKGDESAKAGLDDLSSLDLATLEWRQGGDIEDALKDFGIDIYSRFGNSPKVRFVARTAVVSDSDRTAALVVATDWWTRAMLNGEEVATDRKADDAGRDGAGFSGTTPANLAVLDLRKGCNELVLLNAGGTQGCSFGAWIAADGGIKTGNPRKER